MHGDRVVARITRDERYSRARGGDARPEGRIIRILRARARHDRRHAAAIEELLLRRAGRSAHRAQRLRADAAAHAAAEAAGARRQSRRPARELGIAPRQSRGRDHRSARARARRPGVDMLSIIRKYHLPIEFPRAVLDEAERIPGDGRPPRMPKVAKICASNSSSRSIRMTRAISTTRSTSSDCTAAAGSSASTSPMSPPTSRPAARSTARR